MKILSIDAPSRPHKIAFSQSGLAGFFEDAEGLIREACRSGNAAVVSDENVWAIHGKALESCLSRLGIRHSTITFPQGEGSKTLAMLEVIYKELFAANHGRGDVVIAFGGGVTGDLTGFAAATYMRGVPLVQIPTTLLAQVDSSIGGKVAVNLDGGKNLAGTFYQPDLVVIDTKLLETLPLRELKSGMAEVIKYAAIDSAALLDMLEAADGAPDRLEEIIYLCCKSKIGFVEADERDNGPRMALNFGHTFGHAIEKHYGYRKYSHGEGVAMGMMLAASTGVALGVTGADTERRLRSLLQKNGLHTDFEKSPAVLVPLMAGDKKNSGGEISLVLLREFGRPHIYKIPPAKLARLLGGPLTESVKAQVTEAGGGETC